MEEFWWGNEEKVTQRLKTEVSLMRNHFGDRAILSVDKNTGKAYWDVTFWVSIIECPADKRKQTIRIHYPSNYPNEAPKCVAYEPAITNAPHQLGGGVMCLFNWGEGVNHGWNPSHGTALTIALWGIEWVNTYWAWSVTKKWAGEEHRVKDRVDAGYDIVKHTETVEVTRNASARDRLNRFKK